MLSLFACRCFVMPCPTLASLSACFLVSVHNRFSRFRSRIVSVAFGCRFLHLSLGVGFAWVLFSFVGLFVGWSVSTLGLYVQGQLRLGAPRVGTFGVLPFTSVCLWAVRSGTLEVSTHGCRYV